jgi:hypothetical protein
VKGRNLDPYDGRKISFHILFSSFGRKGAKGIEKGLGWVPSIPFLS